MSVVFRTDADARREQAAADRLERAWGCEVWYTGDLEPVDWHIVIGHRLRAVAELKVRTHGRRTYPTVFLAVAKYTALRAASATHGVPGLFVVHFLGDDALGYINIDRVDATRPHVAGRPPRPGAVHDQEPMLEVPVAALMLVP